MKKLKTAILCALILSIVVSGCRLQPKTNPQTEEKSDVPSVSVEKEKPEKKEDSKTDEKERNGKSLGKSLNKKNKPAQNPDTSQGNTEDPYAAVIEEYYQFMMNYDYNSEKDTSDIDDSKAAIWEMFLTMEREEIMESVGYAVEDINEDEIPELFVGLVDNDSGTSEVDSIYAMFTLVNKKPTLILAGNPRDRYYCLANGQKGYFLNEMSGGEGIFFSVYQLEQQGKSLKFVESVFSPEEKKYYYTSKENWEPEHSEAIDADAYKNFVGDLIMMIEAVRFTPFSEYEGEKEKKSKKPMPKSLEKSTDPLVFQREESIHQLLLGEWTYWHAGSSKEMARLLVGEDHSYSFEITSPKNKGKYASEGYINILDYTQDESGFNNTISFQTTNFSVPEEEKSMYVGDNFDGDYVLTYKALGDGEIVIELYQINNGISFLYEIFDSPVHVFRKTVDYPQTTTVKKNTEFYAMCSKVDYQNNRMWLDEVMYDPENKIITSLPPMEAVAYEVVKPLKNPKKLGIEYECSLWQIKTNAEGKVISMKQIVYDSYPFAE